MCNLHFAMTVKCECFFTLVSPYKFCLLRPIFYFILFFSSFSLVSLQFGNLPYGFRANTWLVPPVAAQSPTVFPPLPMEDENWGGNGGGLGRDGECDLIPWANEFSFIASMPCKTAEERQVRDRKAFLLHSLFVDVAIFRAIKVVQHVMGQPNLTFSDAKNEILYTETVGDLSIRVLKDASVANCKIDTKIDGVVATGVNQKDLVKRNLLKGITADENTAAHV